ncbi:lipopolysaccharide biosynthesis protein [Enterococcus sp. LJL90]
MENFYQKILKRQVSPKTETLWYSIGSSVYAASSVFLLLFVTRFLGTFEAGVFSIGWAVCQLMLTIGYFGSRNYQVADIHDNFSFSYYFKSKAVTISAMLIGTFIYGSLLGFDQYKMTIAFLLTALMICETFADVFAGFLQKQNRLDISGKSYLGRVFSYDCLFLILLLVTENLQLSLIGAIFVSLCWVFLFDYQFVRRLDKTATKRVSPKRISQLLVYSFPIFLSAFLTNFIMNTPKNAIEVLLNEDFQTVYNILFMPSAIIALFTSFVFVPMYTHISKAWHDRRYQEFMQIVKKIVLLVFGLTVVVVIGGLLIGVPVLSIIYGVDISGYRLEFAILLVAGGVNSLTYLLVYLLTVFNSQRLLLFIYSLVAILATLGGNYLVLHFQLLGASLLYLASVISLVLLLVISVTKIYRQEKNNQSTIL